MIRFMIFALFGMFGMAGVKDGTFTLITACIGLSILAFLFWGTGLLFGGDGWVIRIRNRKKLSIQEKEDLEFLREYDSLFLYSRALCGMDIKDIDKMIEKERKHEKYWTLQKKLIETKKFISEGNGSKTFRDMAQARIWKIQAYADEQSALNFLE